MELGQGGDAVRGQASLNLRPGASFDTAFGLLRTNGVS
jgi:hypothetical protein